jgi:hypothetical protein
VLFDNTSYPKLHVDALAVGLRITESLKCLDLNGLTIDSNISSSLTVGFEGNPTLETLALICCRFHDNDSVRNISRSFRGLRSMLSDNSLEMMVRGLQHNPFLEKLELFFLRWDRKTIDSVRALLELNRLRHLEMSQMRCPTGEDYMNLSSLVSVLARTTTLGTLKLRGNRLGSFQSMACLASALTQNTSIKNLDLSRSMTSTVDIDILCSRIPHMKVLQQLDLRFNKLSHDDSRELLAAVKSNYELRLVKLDHSLKHHKNIIYYTDLNFGGRKFLEPNITVERSSCINVTVNPALWPVILARPNVDNLPSDECHCNILACIQAEERQVERIANVQYYLLRNYVISCYSNRYSNRDVCGR